MSGPEVLYEWNGPPVVRLWGQRADDPRSERIYHWLEIGSHPGAVVIARRDRSILFVVSHRPAVGGELLELPRGFGEVVDGEAGGMAAPVRTGMRELREETGYSASNARLLGTYVLDSSVYPAQTAVVACDVVGEPSEEVDGEVQSVRWIDSSSVTALVASGAIRDGHSLSALALWQAVGDAGPGAGG